ncbi:glycosyltransferase [Ruminococcus sp.]|uniref:glycosyltransferase n=1 Tax=Ruminococcus sp. TaxID=41978 RepID=UPI0025D99811|nr:glycosyltransferase [Ruminococcus sp.]
MKILQISNYLYPHIGGIEQVARDIAASLHDREDTEQMIICFNEDAQDGEYTCRRGENVTDEVDGVKVVRCGCIAKAASQSISLSYPCGLKRTLADFAPDIVIFHYPNPYVASFLLPMLKKETKLIVYWHLDITKQKYLGKLFHFQTLRLCRRASRIVATSPNYIDGSPYLSSFRDKCTVIPNCISADRLKTTPAIEEKAEKIRRRFAGKTIVFAVGRHVEYKGMKYLVRAAKFLGYDFAVLIGGKGPLTGELFRERAGDKNVRMLGRIDDETLAACLTACDIFAFPSITKNEAFGIALAEGMYFGKPAVTFTIKGSGVNYVSLDGVTGTECPNADTEAYAEALKKLAYDEELRGRYGAAARQRVMDNFMFEGFRDRVNRLITEVEP